MSALADLEVAAGPTPSPASPALDLVDEQHPWLGLDSFSEETRHYFHGREEEIGELARRVQRKTLTILFGQSGLGKTSILRAGIVPRLRREGYCPVYVRIDYQPESPPPSQQIKQAIFRATEHAGRWTQPGSAVPGESLWEFLHHRDDMLVDASGRTLTPLLIFDQFEEIFTLGQDDDFGRRRAAEFVEDLADLVENRAPKSLEAMLETEETIVDRFDFNRADYRILIALREDYLAHLESFKGAMPSITQNRMRLARMTGEQALAAVTKPGGKLVSEEVAESIVRYVAGGAELRNAEVEPSLLSLVCRELRHEREAKEEAERQLEAQRARELATRKALVRARQIAAGCAVLAIGAIASAIFGYQNMKRAQGAEAQAQQTRQMAEGARGEAEKLITFLLDDFYVELEPVGRLDVVGDLARRALDYYAALPPELRTDETERNRALAQVRYSLVLRNQAKLDDAAKAASDANAVLARLHGAGDRSEVTTIGLGLGLSALARVQDSRARFDEARKLAAESAEVFTPLMSSSPSVRTRRTYAYVMNYLGFLQMRQSKEEAGVQSLESARRAYRSITDQDAADVSAASGYTESSAWQMEALARLGRNAEAKVIGEEARREATRILEVRPGHMGAIRARALTLSNLGALEAADYRASAAHALYSDSEKDWETFLKLDPGNTVAWNNLASVRNRVGFTLDVMGRSQEGIAKTRSALEIERHSRLASTTAMGLAFITSGLAESLAEVNEPKQAAAALAEIRRLVDIVRKSVPPDSVRGKMLPNFPKFQADHVALISGNVEAARDGMRSSIALLESFKDPQGTERNMVQNASVAAHADLGFAFYQLRDFAGAEAALRTSIQTREKLGQRPIWEELQDQGNRALLALSVARQGRREEAAQMIEPLLKKQRAIAAGGSDMLFQRFYLALSLLAAAVADPVRSPALLAEAAATIDRLPADITRRRTVALVRGWIADEMKKKGSG